MKGVFDTKRDFGYDDDITRCYHFPSRYLPVAETLVGDWIVYREPQRNNGRRAYIAVARVRRIDLDPELPKHAFAIIDEYFRNAP